MSRFITILLLLTIVSLNDLSAKIANDCTAEYSYVVVDEISPLTLEFIDESVCINSNIISWEWDFGDGEVSNHQYPQHQYFHEGDYIVTLHIIADNGCTSTKTDTISVIKGEIKSCTAFFTYMIDTAATPYTYNFTDHSISANSPLNNWFWDFGDGTPAIAQQNPSHQFADTGYYDVTLVCVAVDSCYAVHTERIHVVEYALDCNALFTHSVNNNIVSFVDNSSTYGPITSWSWNFGDGDLSNTQNPNHQYSNAGVYNVTLIIGTNNCTDSITIPIVVGNPNNYSVWGRVYVGNLTTDQCQAFLYRKYQYNFILPVDTVNLTSVNDSLGIYYFYQIPEGEYYVQLRIPNTSGYSEDYCPTYYGDSPFWAQSQAMQVFSDKSNMHINMQEIIHETGYNYISGSIANSVNGIIENVLALLYNQSGDVVDYTYSDSIGEYAFENVGSGIYSVYGELTGFAAIPAVTPDLNNYDSITNVNFIIEHSTSTGYIINDEDVSENNYKIYPNPVINNKFFIKFDNNITEESNYSIINAIGIEVERGILDANEQGFNVSLQNELSSGVYLISIKSINGEFMGTKKIIIN